EVAAIRGHRLHNAEGKLRLIRELAGMDLFGVRLGIPMKSIDLAEPSGDLLPSHPAHGGAEGVADGHAEQCAEELVLCSVWHLNHPTSPASASASWTLKPVES